MNTHTASIRSFPRICESAHLNLHGDHMGDLYIVNLLIVLGWGWEPGWDWEYGVALDNNHGNCFPCGKRQDIFKIVESTLF